jgi:hypothetical protein
MPRKTGIMKLKDYIPDLFELDYLIPDFLNPKYKTAKVIRRKK